MGRPSGGGHRFLDSSRCLHRWISTQIYIASGSDTRLNTPLVNFEWEDGVPAAVVRIVGDSVYRVQAVCESTPRPR